MPDPIAIIDLSIRDALSVTITTHSGRRLTGRPLHIGPKTVWIVVGNVDVFVPLDEIGGAE